jgi:hypothetical protein
MERTYANADGQHQPDRRTNPELRGIFEQVCELVCPFLAPENHWAGQSLSRLAFRAVRDRFPELPAESVRVLVQACMRRQQEMQLHAKDRDAVELQHS